MTYVLTYQRYIKLPVHYISHTGTGDTEKKRFEGNNKPKGLNKFPRRQKIDKRLMAFKPGRVAQSVGHLTRKSGVLGSIPGLATYFRFSFRFFKKGSCQLLAKVCARSTG